LRALPMVSPPLPRAGSQSSTMMWPPKFAGKCRVSSYSRGRLVPVERARRGQRLRAGVPYGHWKTTIFVAGLRLTAERAHDFAAAAYDAL